MDGLKCQAIAKANGRDNLKTGTFKIRTILSRFQIVFDKMVANCPFFKWSGFQTSDPI